MTEEKLYGVHPVQAALREGRGRVQKLYIQGNRHGAGIQNIVTMAEQQGIPITTVTSRQLQHLLGHEGHQGIVALVAPYTYHAFEDVIASMEATPTPHVVLVLDGMTDVGNFAALIRSAVAFGVEAILLPRHRSVALTPTVAKLSAGALTQLAVVQVTNVASALETLKQHDFWVYGAHMEAPIAVADMQWPGRVALVLGAEGHGIRRLVRKYCDAFVRIPMRAGVDSLNVTVAGAIILASYWHARSRGDIPHGQHSGTTETAPGARMTPAAASAGHEA